MTPDELDAAIRQELQFAARLAPEPGPVRRRVLLAAESLEENPLPVRGLRAWTVPLLAAAAAVLVALGLAAATTVLRADRSPAPPAGSVSPAPASPGPTRSSRPVSPSSSAKPSGAAGPSGTASTVAGGGVVSHGSSASPGGQDASRPVAGNPGPVSSDWFRGLGVAGLPHTPGLCPGTVDHVSGMGAPSVSVPGEPAPLWLVPVSCVGADESGARPVEVFRSTPDGPRLVQTLAYQAGDTRLLEVTAISVGYGRVLLSESGYHETYDARCCRSLRFTQAYTWDAGHFVAGPQQDAVLACTDDQLTVSSSPLPAADGTGTAGSLMVYANRSGVPCALGGFPRAVVSDADHPTPADAAQTATGALGGLPPGTEDQPRLVLFDAVVGSAVVEWSVDGQSASRCWTTASVTSTPPDGLGAITDLGTQPLVCDPQVHPVVYGSSGRQQTSR